MTVNRPIRACVILLLVAVTVRAGASAQADSDPATKTIEHGGLTRTYRIHVPPSYDGTKAIPLVFVFHGGGGTSLNAERFYGFNPLADRYGFLVVYPQGVENHWNDGRVGERFPRATEIDDVGFIRVLMDRLTKEYKIDPDRIHTAGHSNGGFFSHRLGWELADRFAAIASMAGTLDPAMSRRFAPAQPVHVLDIHGTKDGTVPFVGGEVAAKGGMCLSVPAMIALWVQADGCKGEPTVENLPDKDPADGTSVRRESYKPGLKGAEVVLYVVEGHGHSWPGRDPRGDSPTPITRELDATEVICQFFASHPKVRSDARR